MDKKTNYVGIVYGKDNSPLYCEGSGSSWVVINGAWDFKKKTKLIYGRHEWRIVLRNMKPTNDYNVACELIREATQQEPLYNDFDHAMSFLEDSSV